MKTFSPKSILVLCEGNHCRSPIAEGLLRQALGPSIQVGSAGLGALDGIPPHPEAVRLAAALGVDISDQRSRRLTPSLALGHDLILVMEQAQKDWCGALAPSARGRIFLLGAWLPPDRREIGDPFGRDPEAFREAAERIQQGVQAWRKHLHVD